MSNQVERLSAKSYYGRHATGVVVLVNGQPHHFTGAGSGRDATAFIKSVGNCDTVINQQRSS